MTHKEVRLVVFPDIDIDTDGDPHEVWGDVTMTITMTQSSPCHDMSIMGNTVYSSIVRWKREQCLPGNQCCPTKKTLYSNSCDLIMRNPGIR